MADTAAERMRRARAHKRGDHSLCQPERCEHVTAGVTATVTPAAVTPTPAEDAPEQAESVPGGIERAVAAYVDMLGYRANDPRALLGQIAVRLAQRVDESGALPAAVRELRVLLGQLAEVPGQPPGPVDELQVRRAQRRLDQILANVG